MRNSIAMISLLLLSPFAAAQQDLDTSAFDRNVRVQDDLFLHVNGTWLRNTEIPSDKSDYGSFIQLADLSLERIRDLIEEVSEESHPIGSDWQKVGDFYRSFMNEDAIEAAGLEPIADDLEKIDAIDSKDALFALMGYLQTIGVETPVGFFVDQDDKDSTRYMAQLVQSGLTLPDRDYYLKDDEKSAACAGSTDNLYQEDMRVGRYRTECGRYRKTGNAIGRSSLGTHQTSTGESSIQQTYVGGIGKTDSEPELEDIF